MAEARQATDVSRNAPPAVPFRQAAVAMVLLFPLFGLPAMLTPHTQSIWWPPAALEYAGVLIYGPWFAPVIIAARMFHDLIFDRLISGTWQLREYLLVEGTVALIVTGTYTVVAEGVRRLGANWRLYCLRDVLLIAGGSVVAAQFIAWAATGLLVHVATSPIWHDQSWTRAAIQWWTGEQVALLAITPAILVSLRSCRSN